MAKSKALTKPAGTVEVLAAESEELTLARETNAAIASFMKGVVAFFRTAAAFEKRAEATLAGARTFKTPTTADEDALLQKQLRRSNDEDKESAEHWNPICSTIFSFHRYMTGRRGLAAGLHKEVRELLQPMHNRFVDDQKRKAAAEQERLRREAEQRAQKERDDELQRLEDAALKAEASSADLSEREQRFVELVAYGLNSATTSARTAGYKNPEAAGLKLLNTKKIIAAIEGKKAAQASRQQAEARAALPLDVEDVPDVKPDLARGVRGHDRTTYGAELIEESALIKATLRSIVVAYVEATPTYTNINGLVNLDGAFEQALKTSAIPIDLLRIHEPTLNVHGKALQEKINLWPGVRAKKTTTSI